MGFVEKVNAFIGADKPKLADFYACFDQLYMLLNSGSTLQQAINEIAHVQTNVKLGQALRNISRNLSAGVATGAAFKKEGVFPGWLLLLLNPVIEQVVFQIRFSGFLN